MDETLEVQPHIDTSKNLKDINTSSAIEIPEQITNDWIDKALKEGEFAVHSTGNDGKEVVRTVFIKKFPDDVSAEKARLNDKYGVSHNLATLYHGTSAESLPSLSRNGLFGRADHPTLSIDPANEVKSTALNRQSDIGRGIVAYFRVPWNEVHIIPNSFPETVGWPNVPYTGERPKIPSYLADEPNILHIPPERIVGIYIVDQK